MSSPVFYNPGGIVRLDTQHTVITNLEYFHLRVPSFRSLGISPTAGSVGRVDVKGDGPVYDLYNLYRELYKGFPREPAQLCLVHTHLSHEGTCLSACQSVGGAPTDKRVVSP